MIQFDVVRRIFLIAYPVTASQIAATAVQNVSLVFAVRCAKSLFATHDGPPRNGPHSGSGSAEFLVADVISCLCVGYSLFYVCGVSVVIGLSASIDYQVQEALADGTDSDTDTDFADREGVVVHASEAQPLRARGDDAHLHALPRGWLPRALRVSVAAGICGVVAAAVVSALALLLGPAVVGALMRPELAPGVSLFLCGAAVLMLPALALLQAFTKFMQNEAEAAGGASAFTIFGGVNVVAVSSGVLLATSVMYHAAAFAWLVPPCRALAVTWLARFDNTATVGVRVGPSPTLLATRATEEAVVALVACAVVAQTAAVWTDLAFVAYCALFRRVADVEGAAVEGRRGTLLAKRLAAVRAAAWRAFRRGSSQDARRYGASALPFLLVVLSEGIVMDAIVLLGALCACAPERIGGFVLAMQLTWFLFPVGSGLGSALSTVVSQASPTARSSVVASGVALAAVVALVDCALIATVGREVLPLVFQLRSDGAAAPTGAAPEAMSHALRCLPLVVVLHWVDVVQFVLQCAFRGLGLARRVLAIAFACQWVVGLPLAALLVGRACDAAFADAPAAFRRSLDDGGDGRSAGAPGPWWGRFPVPLPPLSFVRDAVAEQQGPQLAAVGYTATLVLLEVPVLATVLWLHIRRAAEAAAAAGNCAEPPPEAFALQETKAAEAAGGPYGSCS